MTTKDAVLALAAKIAGTTQDNVSTTAQALTKLAYAATGQAPTTDLMTVDDCIAFITANYTPGGGGGTIDEVTFWNNAANSPENELVPTKVEYLAGLDDGAPVYEALTIEAVSSETQHGFKAHDVPCGASLLLTFESPYASDFSTGLVMGEDLYASCSGAVLAPEDGLTVTGVYEPFED